MNQTLTEKIISNHAGKEVKAGDVVFVDVDRAFVQDGTGPLTVNVIREMDRGLHLPSHKYLFLDHASPSSKSELSDAHKLLRDFADETGACVSDVGEGICHQIVAERYALPGEIIVGADSHTCTAGALGAFASGFGSTDIAFAMATGRLWLKVPPAIKVVLEGKLSRGVSAKDVILSLIGRLSASGATYKALEFSGSGIENLSVEDRLTICNMVIEAGAKNGIMPADEKVKSYLRDKREEKIDFEFLRADSGAVYEREIKLNLNEIEPVAAEPHCVDNVREVREIEKEKIKVDQVLIGTCTGGRIEDLRAAAKILDGRKVSPGTRLGVCPASKKVFLQAIEEGLVNVFVHSGAFMITPGCGPCVGIQGGVLGKDEVCVSTANRNFKGRMGCPESYIYLASPITAAASAVKGYIALGEEFLT
ncbi:MAG: 3-isopropylmalate dehydratase large subunit [Elusimicrobiota bacterium]